MEDAQDYRVGAREVYMGLHGIPTKTVGLWEMQNYKCKMGGWWVSTCQRTGTDQMVVPL